MYIPLEYGCIEKLITSVIKKNTLDFFFSFLIRPLFLKISCEVINYGLHIFHKKASNCESPPSPGNFQHFFFSSFFF